MAEQCARIGTSDRVRDDVLLLTSEVVANAVTHGRSEVRLSLRGNRLGVRVDVSDDNTRLPTRQPHDPDALDGRGLSLVDQLADRWGVDSAALGKTVWFEVCE